MSYVMIVFFPRSSVQHLILQYNAFVHTDAMRCAKTLVFILQKFEITAATTTMSDFFWLFCRNSFVLMDVGHVWVC